MPDTPTIVHRYEKIADISGKMLRLAQANDWDSVLELSRQYCDAVEALRPLSQLKSEDRAVRKSLLTQILDDDARIRNLAAPEMARLGSLVGAMKRHQHVLEAYCNVSPSSH